MQYPVILIKHLLGDVKSSEEASDVLVGGLPWQPTSSHHRVVIHVLVLCAAKGQEQDDSVSHK